MSHSAAEASVPPECLRIRSLLDRGEELAEADLLHLDACDGCVAHAESLTDRDAVVRLLRREREGGRSGETRRGALLVALLCLAAVAGAISSWWACRSEDEARRTADLGGSSLRLLDGELNGEILDPARPAVVVLPGDRLRGELRVALDKRLPAEVELPLVLVAAYGDPRARYWPVGSQRAPGESVHVVAFDLPPADQVGTYALVVAAGRVKDAEHLASCTAAGAEGCCWDDGRELALLPESTLVALNREGRAGVAMGGSPGSEERLHEIAGTAVRVHPSLLGTVRMAGGALNGLPLDTLRPSLRVAPGDSITGRFAVRIHNEVQAGAVFAVAATSSWGEPRESYWPVDRINAPADTHFWVDVRLRAPERPGRHHIIVAGGYELDADDVMSCTNWALGEPCWDENDVARWPPWVIDEALRRGRVLVPFAHAQVDRFRGLCELAATAVIVEVWED